MQISAETKYVRMSPRKIRLVAHAVRRLSLTRAMTFLAQLDKKAADPIRATLASAVANAEHNHKQSKESLFIESVEVDEGPAFKRWRAASRGMAHGYKRRTSHVKVTLGVKKDAIQKGEKKEIKQDEKTNKLSDKKTKLDAEAVKNEVNKSKSVQPIVPSELKPGGEPRKGGRFASLAGRFVKPSGNRTTNK